MDSDKNLEKLNESAADSAQRQDDIFNRIESIVQENPESAKQYLQHLTQSSKWELYGRIYSKFAYITLLIAFVIVALIFSLNKLREPNNAAICDQFINSKPQLYLTNDTNNKYLVSLRNDNSDDLQAIAYLQNFNSELTLNKKNSRWQLLKNEVLLGNINVSVNNSSLQFDGKPYKIGTEHSFGNHKKLRFKIESFFDYKVPNSSDTTTRTMYRVVFGEKIKDKTLWNLDAPVEIMKSDNARGIINGSNRNTYFINHESWQNSYIVEMAIGKLASDKLFVYYIFGNAYSISLQ